MQKVTLLCSLSTILILVVGLSSCKDDEPFVKPNLSVESATLTVGESGGTIEVGVVLDKGAPGDITIEYDLGGTALSPADYSVVGTEGEIEIADGQTTGTIEIEIVSDALFEGDETIEISLQDVDSDDVLITNDDETEITITDDDTQVTASFASPTLTVSESDNAALLEIEVVLSSPAAQAVTIQFEPTHEDGHAIDDIYGTAEDIPQQYFDYAIEGGEQEITIAQGATTGVIQLQLFSDFHFEDDEIIELTLTEASNGVQVSAEKMTITLEQENGRVIALVWENTYTDVDMDMFLWIGDDIADLSFVDLSANASVTTRLEVLFIPEVIQDAAFGLSYTYYSGTQTPMNFEAQFADFTDGVVEPEANWDIYPGTYTLANINKWDDDNAPDPYIIQTFKKVAGAFVDVTSPLVPPASGSRVPTSVLPKSLKKINTINQMRKF